MAGPARSAKDIFLEAVERPAEQWAAFVGEACGGNVELQQRVEALLKAHADAGSIPHAEPLSPATGDFVPSMPGELAGVGHSIGPYKLLQKLGEGGMGVVWLAEQEQPVRRRVALKVIKAGMDSAQVLARFEAERQALALMDHPNIAKVLDAGCFNDRPYVVMELVKGVPITKYCDQVHLTPKERLELFIPVCQAVQHAHQKGIIHRDLKPSNVIVGLYDGKPIPKVIDFGVAKATSQRLTERTMFTEVGQIVGTLEYMAPEQAELNNLDIDTRADIYSLGVILYELLAGTPPFTRKQFESAAFSEMLRMIKEVEPQKPSTKLSSSHELATIAANRHLEPKRLTRLLHGDLDWIVMKCLEKERARRYETANGLALELQRYLADEPVMAGPPSRLYRMRKFVRKNRRSVLAACVLALALIAGVIGTTWGMFQAQAERDLKEQARLQAVEQKNRADEQAAIAAAVNSFLCKDLLQQADSWEQSDQGYVEDPNLTVRVALARAADKINGRFPDQPMVETAVRHTIGNALRGVGEAKQSIPHLERVVDTRTKMLGADHLDTLSTRYDLARAYEDAGRYADAIRVLEEVDRKRTELLGDDHTETLVARHQIAGLYRLTGRLDDSIRLGEQVTNQFATTLGDSDYHTLSSKHNLSIAYVQAGRTDDAIRQLKDVLAKRVVHPGPNHLDTLVTMQVLASAYRYAGRIAESVKLHEEVRDAHIKKLGPEHPRTLVATNMLALAYQSAGRPADALPLLESNRLVQIKKLGIDHPDTLITLHNLAQAYRMTGRLDDAITLFEQLRDRRIAKFGAEHPDTLVTLNNLAISYQTIGRLAESADMFRKVREVQTRTLGADHPDTLITSHNVAITLRNLGKLTEAIQIHEEVRKLQAKKLGEDHPELLITCNNLAMAYLLAGRIDDALTLFTKVHTAQAAKLGADHPDTLITAHNLAVARVNNKQFGEAVPLLEDTVAKSRIKNGVDNANTLTAQNTLGDAYIKNSQFAAAERLLREALDRRVKVLPEHWSTAYTRSLLGAALSAQSKNTDAEPLLIQGFEGLKRTADKIPTPTRTKRLTEAAERLVQHYDAMGKASDAEKWRKELASIQAATKPITP